MFARPVTLGEVPIGVACILGLPTDIAALLRRLARRSNRGLHPADGTPSSLSIPRVLVAWRDAFRGLSVEVLSVAPRDGFVTPWGTTGDDEAVPADEMMELGRYAAAAARAGDPGRQIVSAGLDSGADLIVTGSRGIGTLGRLVEGSVAHDVLLRARSSVLIMRGLVPARIPRTAPALGSLAQS